VKERKTIVGQAEGVIGGNSHIKGIQWKRTKRKKVGNEVYLGGENGVEKKGGEKKEKINVRTQWH